MSELRSSSSEEERSKKERPKEERPGLPHTRQPSAKTASHSGGALSAILDRLYQADWAKLTRDWESWRQRSGLTVVFTPNPEQVVQAQHSPAFLTVVMGADVLLPDGAGLVWACRRLRPQQTCQRFAGRQVVEWWLQEASQRKISTVLLGAPPGVAQALAHQVDPRHEWCVAITGYSDVRQPTAAEETAVQKQIVAVRPQVIFVAFGAPWQEMWVSEHREWLTQQGVKIVMVCGGALDVLSPASQLQKPPAWMERGQLEWLYRLWQQPSRWRRQVRLLQFAWLVWQSRL